MELADRCAHRAHQGALTLVADALPFVGSALFLTRIHAPEAPIEHDQGSIRSQLTTGLRFLVRDPIIRPTVLSIATVNLFNYCFQGAPTARSGS